MFSKEGPEIYVGREGRAHIFGRSRRLHGRERQLEYMWLQEEKVRAREKLRRGKVKNWISSYRPSKILLIITIQRVNSAEMREEESSSDGGVLLE